MVPQFSPVAVAQSVRFKRDNYPTPLLEVDLVGFWHFPDGTTQPLVAYYGRLMTAPDVVMRLARERGLTESSLHYTVHNAVVGA